MTNKPIREIYVNLKALGKTGVEVTRELETVDLPEGHRLSFVSLETNEFTSFCPVTGQPDFGHVSLSYQPRNRIVESKSLKLYWQSFRNEAEFWELLADKMLTDFVDALDPLFCMVSVRQNPRGGIPITASATYRADDLDDDDSTDPSDPAEEFIGSQAFDDIPF